MDIEFARTFLAVIETGSFMKAAEKVHATQSTVSMRIKVIEERLGQALFERKKTGVVLTLAGEKFQRRALSLVRIWEQAKMEAGLPAGVQSMLAVGGQYSLWDELLLPWLSKMRTSHPEIALKASFAPATMLMEHLAQGVLDLAVMYSPQIRPGFRAQHLFDEELVLVTSAKSGDPLGESAYILMDWGESFQADHALRFTNDTQAVMTMDLGTLGLKYLLETEASGYFPQRIVNGYIESGRLDRVYGTPVFTYSAFAVYAERGDNEALKHALDLLVSSSATNSSR